MNLRELAIVVVARGGSKGLPRKNALHLAGIPLLQWTADAVRDAGLTDAACLLSTDDREIAELGRQVGLEVPFERPAALATDQAGVVPVVLHAIDWLSAQGRMTPQWAMLLQPTSPFRPPSSLRAATELAGDDVDAIVGVEPLHRSPSLLYRADANMMLQPLAATPDVSFRRQDLQPLYTPNGALYLVRVSTLRDQQTFFPRRTRGLPMDQIASIDIDDATDWSMAAAIASAGLTWRKA